LEIIQDERISKNHDLFVDGVVCKEITIDDERIDTRFFKMRTINEVKELLRIVNIRKHPFISAYRSFISELGLKPHSRISIKEILRLLGLQKKSIPTNSLNDIMDAVTLSTFVPIKALDLSKVSQPLIIRYSIKGEVFRDYRGITWLLRGSEVVISDSNGDLVALIPFWVSFKHSVKTGYIKDVGLLAFGVKGIPRSFIEKAISITINAVTTFYPGTVCNKFNIYQ